MARFFPVRPALIVGALLAATVAFPRPASRASTLAVTAVRFWTLSDVTRIAIETTGVFHFQSERVPNPDRIYFDIAGAHMRLGVRGMQTIPVNDARVRQLRVALTQRSVTRIVVDLESPVEITASKLSNPDRLIIEIRARAGSQQPTIRPTPPPPAPVAQPPATAPSERKIFVPPTSLPVSMRKPDPLPAPPAIENEQHASVDVNLPPVRTPAAPRTARGRRSAVREAVAEQFARDTVPESRPASRTAPSSDAVPRAAAKNSDGERSMTRVLGLKVGRIVIDPGHGGHDHGTSGRNGLLEKDLVLDVSRRLGKLIAERMGSEVIFTRSDDTFIPLETRTAIANEKRADLFLSVHANSSSIRSISGVETFYLNFSASKSDLDVAARENASSQKTVYELKDLLQKIALQDKVEESREFAARVQASLHALASRNTARQRNRGVKKAPFVVLIGAQMPSILAEVGFVSNPREESLMGRAEHRQKIAEALYKGLAQYAGTLSHFQIARASGDE